MILEAFYDPTVWAGLFTLVVLEIVLGIDNLIFIAILSDKLPPEQRRRARVTGLALALGMRIVLLASISWMATLTSTLFVFLGSEISGRDLIMLVGGVFLLFKATMELHEKLEGGHHKKAGPVRYAGFWAVIIQIIILDAVFSLDAVITAVGMTEHVIIAMIAVTIAMALMILASNKLMDFVSGRPTVVILCLGFLLMIGFSLVIEGFDYHIPKGYLYAAIGFSVLIEGFNQWASHNRRKTIKKIDARTRVTEAVVGLLGMKSTHGVASEISAFVPGKDELSVFKPQERLMIGRVLQLAEQPVRSIMTPRNDIFWIDINEPHDVVQRDLRDCSYSYVVAVQDGTVDEPLGVIHKKDLADLLLKEESLDGLKEIIREPLHLPENLTVLQVMERFQKKRIHVAFVIDEYGSLEGLVTLTDIFEAIAGDMPEDHVEDDFQYEKRKDGSFLVSGKLSVQELRELLGHDLALPEGDFDTVAGVALTVLKKLPQPQDRFVLGRWAFEIVEMEGFRVSRMIVCEA